MEKTNSESSGLPGVSGKSRSGKSWLNTDVYEEQKEHVEHMDEAEKGFAQSTGQNLMGRSDLSNQGEQNSGSPIEKDIFEVLKRAPTVDAANVKVHADNGVITLEGTVLSAKESRAMQHLVENVPGVKKVINQLHAAEGTEF